MLSSTYKDGRPCRVRVRALYRSRSASPRVLAPSTLTKCQEARVGMASRVPFSRVGVSHSHKAEGKREFAANSIVRVRVT